MDIVPRAFKARVLSKRVACLRRLTVATRWHRSQLPCASIPLSVLVGVRFRLTSVSALGLSDGRATPRAEIVLIFGNNYG